MTRRMQDFKADFSKGKLFSILCYMHIKVRFGFWPINNSSTGSLGKVQMAADKVCMKMCFKNIFYGRLSFGGQLQVSINIPQRVYYGCLSIAFNIISSFAY